MEQTRRTYTVIGISIFLFCLIVFGVYYAYTSPVGLKARLSSDIRALNEPEKAVYTTLQGEPTTIEARGDEVLVVNMWASWSPYSNGDFTVLSSIEAKYGDRVRIIALNRMETAATAQAYLASIQTIQTHEGIEYILDSTDYFFKTTGGYAMPETVVFDAIGNVILHERGIATESELSSAIDEILNP